MRMGTVVPSQDLIGALVTVGGREPGWENIPLHMTRQGQMPPRDTNLGLVVSRIVPK
jgi:hypothetical protein